MSRVLGITCGTILLLSATFIAGIYATENRLFPYTLVTQVRNDFQQLLTEGDTLAGIRPKAWTAPPRQDGSGVTLHVPEEAGEELIMLQGLFDRGLEIRLVALDGTVVHRWPFSPATLTEGIEHLRNRPLVEWNYDTHGAVALPDGSVVFNIDHKALLKLDRCGELVWRVDEPTHHSVELNDDGSFWVSSAEKHWDQSTLPLLPFDAPLSEDTLLQVGADGTILREISLLDVFLENDAMGLLTLAGGISPKTYRAYRPDMSREVFHLNDVEALPAAMAAAFPGFEAGDVVISLRNRNLIMVLDPDTKAIKWHSIGNWTRHHDPDWHADGTIRVFDNNRDGTETGEILGSSRIIAIRPRDNTETLLLGAEDDPYFHTTRRGKSQSLSGGRLLITEAEAGRVFITNAANEIVWEYVNRFDDEFIARITEARAYPRAYFSVTSWDCP
ncbi:MAG: arylsulfotransferase family protein [Pseudomonadota bacterium]